MIRDIKGVETLPIRGGDSSLPCIGGAVGGAVGALAPPKAPRTWGGGRFTVVRWSKPKRNRWEGMRRRKETEERGKQMSVRRDSREGLEVANAIARCGYAGRVKQIVVTKQLHLRHKHFL